MHMYLNYLQGELDREGLKDELRIVRIVRRVRSVATSRKVLVEARH